MLLYHPEGFFHLRTPIFSVDFFTEFLSKTENQFAKEILIECLQNIEISTALQYSSNTFFEALKKNLESTKSLDIDIYLKLVKYLSRMSSRPTPLNLYAGCSFGTIGGHNDIVLDMENKRVCENRSITTLAEIYEIKIKEKEFYRHRFTVNNLWYNKGTEIKFFYFKNGKVEFGILESNSLLRCIIKKVSTSECSYEELIKICNPYTHDTHLSENVIDNLIAEYFLIISDLECQISADLFQKTENSDGQFESVIFNDSINLIDPWSSKSKYADVIFNHYRSQLSTKYCMDIGESIADLDFLRLNIIDLHHYKIQSFIKRFTVKYHGAMLSLSNLFDPEDGVNCTYEDHGMITLDDHVKQMEFNNFYNTILHIIEHHEASQYEITEQDRIYFSKYKNKESYSPTMSVFGSILQFESKELPSFYLKSSNEFPSIRQFERFLKYDTAVAKLAGETIEFESKNFSNCILAEICYTDYSKLGDIAKPASRGAFINLRMVKDQNIKSIDIRDIMVFVENNKIKLYSVKYEKEIIPVRSSIKIDTEAKFPIFEFVNLVADQYTRPSLSWDWGLASKRAFLPRITYKNLIISPKSWNLDIKQITSIGGKNNAIMLAQILASANVPKLVYLHTCEDRNLLMDIENDLCLSIIYDFIIKYKSCRLIECLEQQYSLKDRQNRKYVHEVVIPYRIVSSQIYTSKTKIRKLEKQNRKLVFSPLGSEWVCLSITGTQRILETILLEELYRIVKYLHNNQIIKYYHFVRFGGSASCLKFRFKLVSSIPSQILIDKLYKKLEKRLNSGQINDFKYEAYFPEYLRYGVSKMLITEHLFHNDSMIILEYLSGHAILANQDRWFFALKITWLYLEFMFENCHSYELLDFTKQSFFNEFGGSKELKAELNSLFRVERKNICQILAAESIWNNKLILEWRKKIEILNDRNQIDPQNIPHYIHMFINRLFPDNQRKIELEILHCLQKYIAGLQALKKQKGRKC